MIERGIWFVILISWIFNLTYAGAIFFMMFYSIVDSVILFFK